MTPPSVTEYPYVWVWGPNPPMRVLDRKGQPCRVLARARRMNSALIEFADGYRVITSRGGLRRRHVPEED